MSSVPSTSSTGSTSSTSSTSSTTTDPGGFNDLTSDDFMQLLITQLQNQDPTQPVSNSELLDQLSQMRALQSNIELSQTLSTFSTTQQISSAASFLGLNVTGSDANGNPVTGTADRVIFANGEASLGIGSSTVLLSTVSSIDESAVLGTQAADQGTGQ